LIFYLCCIIGLQKKEVDDGDDTVPEEMANDLDGITPESLRVSLYSPIIHFLLVALAKRLR